MPRISRAAMTPSDVHAPRSIDRTDDQPAIRVASTLRASATIPRTVLSTQRWLAGRLGEAPDLAITTVASEASTYSPVATSAAAALDAAAMSRLPPSAPAT